MKSCKKNFYECSSESFNIDHKIVYTTNPVVKKFDDLTEKLLMKILMLSLESPQHLTHLLISIILKTR